jgi:hypothetical protein
MVREGAPERAHVVTVAGRTVVALSTATPDTSIIRVITSDPAFKTSGGVGVGSSVQALRLAHGRICAAQGEGTFVVMAADLPGVSFAIDWTPPAGGRRLEAINWTEADGRTLPPLAGLLFAV